MYKKVMCGCRLDIVQWRVLTNTVQWNPTQRGFPQRGLHYTRLKIT